MKAYRCRVCDNPLHFENSVCVSCGSALGYSRAERALVPVDDEGRYVDAAGASWHVCRHLDLHGCTWLATEAGGQCSACDLTRTRPRADDPAGMAGYPAAERAKRHLLAELDALGLPVVGKDPANGGDPVDGLAFDLLSSTDGPVVTGHQDGVVTIDLAESDDVHRERVRHELAEPYRTVLGHVRHEVGHYVEWQLVRGPALVERCREVFGDEREDYQAALDQHYRDGPPPGWEASYLSAYATMHPFEDFAETWAHYLHISDTIETAAAYGLSAVAPVTAFSRFRDVVNGVWVPLSIALNMVNRSMGKDDLYPFVIPEPVLDKLEFVVGLVRGADERGGGRGSTHPPPGAGSPS